MHAIISLVTICFLLFVLSCNIIHRFMDVVLFFYYTFITHSDRPNRLTHTTQFLNAISITVPYMGGVAHQRNYNNSIGIVEIITMPINHK